MSILEQIALEPWFLVAVLCSLTVVVIQLQLPDRTGPLLYLTMATGVIPLTITLPIRTAVRPVPATYSPRAFHLLPVTAMATPLPVRSPSIFSMMVRRSPTQLLHGSLKRKNWIISRVFLQSSALLVIQMKAIILRMVLASRIPSSLLAHLHRW